MSDRLGWLRARSPVHELKIKSVGQPNLSYMKVTILEAYEENFDA